MTKSLLKKGKFLFNLHLLLGFVISIPLVIVAISGAFLSYHDEILDTLNSEISIVKNPADKMLEVSQILSNLDKKLSGFNASLISFDGNQSKAMQISGTQNGAFYSYFIDPYTAEIISPNLGDKVIGILLNLHINLGLNLIDSQNLTLRYIGKNIVAICTVALILITLSGIILFYPYFRRRLLRTFRINFKANIHTLFYQLHGAIGISVSVIIFIISFTGLYFSYDFVAKLVNKALGEEQIFKKGYFTDRMGVDLNDSKRLKELDMVFQIFSNQMKEYQFFSILPSQNDTIYSAVYASKDADEDEVNSLIINTKAAKITKHIKFSDEKSANSAANIAHAVLDLHMGYTFGNVGKFIFCLSSILIFVLLLSGFVMSIKRMKIW